jgi:DNA polymerase-1
MKARSRFVAFVLVIAFGTTTSSFAREETDGGSVAADALIARPFWFVETILGRRRTLPDINSPVQSRRQFSQRAALNSVIQGSAADLIKRAMVNIHRRIREHADEIRMLIQIHDELVFECRADRAKEWSSMIREEMEHAMRLKVPLKVDLGIGKNWLEYE